jgi:hypothetical protein
MKIAFLLIICGMVVFAAPVGASFSSALSVGFRGSPGASGAPTDWSLKVHRGTARLNLVTEDGKNILHMKAEKSSFALEHSMAVDIAEYPYLVWTWKAVSLPSRGDVREKSKDDQALQLLVAFDDGRVLSYVWDTNAPEGTVVDESLPWPLSIKIKVVVVDSGYAERGKWVTNSRNVYNDYRTLFRKDPPPVKGIRVQMNTQHTGDTAEGFVKDVVFSRTLS